MMVPLLRIVAEEREAGTTRPSVPFKELDRIGRLAISPELVMVKGLK